MAKVNFSLLGIAYPELIAAHFMVRQLIMNRATPKIFQQIEADALDIPLPLSPRPPQRNEPLPRAGSDSPAPPCGRASLPHGGALLWAKNKSSDRYNSLHRHETQDAVVGAGGPPAPVTIRSRIVERAVRPFGDFANAPIIFTEHALLADDAAAIEHDATHALP